MMSVYGLEAGRLSRREVPVSSADAGALWIDLFDPSPEEVRSVEALIGLTVPTRQEMAEIEESARLYEEGGALVVTAVVIAGVAEDRPSRTQVTFVLSPTHLVCVRYADPVPFRAFDARAQRQPEGYTTSERIFVSLLESIVERAADVLEIVAAELNEVSTTLFIDGEKRRGKPTSVEDDLQSLIRRLGRRNMTCSILRESLLSLTRLVPFVRQNAEWLGNGAPARLKQIERDLRSLTAYEAQLSSEIVYLHDATLGLINLDQNRIIKVFSVAAVLFLPPTLVGTIYGMNFEAMPELRWGFGYAFALALMIVSAVLPYWWFRRRGWL